MSAGAGAAASGAAAAYAIAQAINASGVIVRVEPGEFLRILERQEEPPLVVHATGGFFSTSYRYLSSYKGLAFYTKSPEPVDIPSDWEVVQARKIWVPGY